MQGLAVEDTVLATKIYENSTFAAFRLPLRTRVTVGVEKGAGSGGVTPRNILLSDADGFAEEVSQQTYDSALKRASHQDATPSALSQSDRGNYSIVTYATYVLHRGPSLVSAIIPTCR